MKCSGEICVGEINHDRHRPDVEESVKGEEETRQRSKVVFKGREVLVKGPAPQEWPKRLQNEERNQEESYCRLCKSIFPSLTNEDERELGEGSYQNQLEEKDQQIE